MRGWAPNKNKVVKAFIYGDPGAGKTTFFGTVMEDPRTAPAYWINCAGNPDSIRKNKILPPVMITLDSTKDLNEIYNWFNQGQPRTTKDGKPHPHVVALEAAGQTIPWPSAEAGILAKPFKSIVFDGITEYQRMRLDEILGNDNKKPADQLASAQIQHWGQMLQSLTYVARLLFTGLDDISVFIGCLEYEKTDEMTKAVSYGPALWGQGRAEVPGYSLLTGRMMRRSKMSSDAKKEMTIDVYSALYLAQEGRFMAKEQYGGLPKSMPSPTIPQLMDLIYGPAK